MLLACLLQQCQPHLLQSGVGSSPLEEEETRMWSLWKRIAEHLHKSCTDISHKDKRHPALLLPILTFWYPWQSSFAFRWHCCSSLSCPCFSMPCAICTSLSIFLKLFHSWAWTASSTHRPSRSRTSCLLSARVLLVPLCTWSWPDLMIGCTQQ